MSFIVSMMLCDRRKGRSKYRGLLKYVVIGPFDARIYQSYKYSRSPPTWCRVPIVKRHRNRIYVLDRRRLPYKIRWICLFTGATASVESLLSLIESSALLCLRRLIERAHLYRAYGDLFFMEFTRLCMPVAVTSRASMIQDSDTI